MKLHSLRKSKKVFILVSKLLRRKKKKLLSAQVKEITRDLQALQAEILKKNREGASHEADKCYAYTKGLLAKTPFEKWRDVFCNLAFMLAVLVVIRLVWWELYHIPTGSMRPTFKEKDLLLVSKTTFGINVPLANKQFYFDPDLVKRAGTIVFSTENMDVYDSDTRYFGVLPGKKQFVKRMMGRAGDTIYFYGGRVYGIDANGKDVSADYQYPHLKNIDYVPVIRFEGKVTTGEPFNTRLGPAYQMSILHQMNEPVARLTALSPTRFEGEMLHNPRIHDGGAPLVENYFELWGIGNYAKARIVSRDDVRSFADRYGLDTQDAQYFLDLNHHPNLKHLELARDNYGRLRPSFILSMSILPLTDESLRALFANMYTGRFVVKNGFAMRYHPGGHSHTSSHNLVRLEGVPDGTYEFFNGQAYKISNVMIPLMSGISKKLPPNHPLQTYSAEKTVNLFNFGIEFDKRAALGPFFQTSRFAYFRNGDLFLLNAPIFKKGNDTLTAFEEREKEREASANSQNPYYGFLDAGPPKDADFIKQYGLKIPQKSYVALGDNYAMSGDSREFGFVPSQNLRGSPSFIFWPPSSRLGFPNQPPYPWVTLPHIIVWGLAALCIGIWIWYHRRHNVLPLKFDDED